MDGGSGERDIADTGQKHSTENMINRQMLREGVLLSHSWSSEYPLFLFEKPSTPNNFPCQAGPYHFILMHILSYIKMTILIRQKAKLAEHSTFSYSWLWVTGEKKPAIIACDALGHSKALWVSKLQWIQVGCLGAFLVWYRFKSCLLFLWCSSWRWKETSTGS